MIKVVDIFAGPGGLSEGFGAVTSEQGTSEFDVVLSIEKDETAYATLRLRTFYRQFLDAVPSEYYRFLRNELSASELYESHLSQTQATDERCWNAVLGPGGEPTENISKKISTALGDDTGWVLIGGPPCQAYSIAGRSRNRGNPMYDPSKDVRQRLYVEYLRILAQHRPAVFILENVKGLLSATYDNECMFSRILEDLREPSVALVREGITSSGPPQGGYRIYSLCENREFNNGHLEGSVIRAELFGVPQARHRVVLLGIRDDISGVTPAILKPQTIVPASKVLEGLPKLRSGISPQSADSGKAWQKCLQSQVARRWANAGTIRVDGNKLSEHIRRNLGAIRLPRAQRGGTFVRAKVTSNYSTDWYCDAALGGACNHESRGHMESDLFRYMYAASYAKLHGRSPSLWEFPTDLIPEHESANDAIVEGGNFADRFRVQLSTKPSTTIVSHISKDGHYYIHPDPLQCRTLTVREAARLQTFPDNYFFCGPRTAQYVQVGNAVPPLLAKQIGEIVLDVLKQAGSN